MRIGFIGAGNMGQAIIRSLVNRKALNPSEITVSRLHADKEDWLRYSSITIVNDNCFVAQSCEYIFMAIKPGQAESVISEIKEHFENKVLVSIMAGWEFDHLQRMLPNSTHIICAMPNIPVSVGAGTILLSNHTNCTAKEREYITRLFSCIGKTVWLDEKHFAAANAITGCGPAFAAMFIEALSEGAVFEGLPRDTSYQLAEQMLIGTAQYLLENNCHPGVLKDMVCSPNGTTIRGVRALDEGAFKGVVENAVITTVRRNQELTEHKH